MQPETPAASGEIQTPQLEFDVALKEARSGFYDITFEDGFSELAAKRGISPDDTDKPAYWRTVADYARHRAGAARNRGEQTSPLDELVASTPDFLYTQAMLDDPARRSKMDHEQYSTLRARVGRFNTLIRDVAETHPDVRASGLTNAMVGIANISMEQERLRKAAPNLIRPVIRGAQHEAAFGQLLEQTGRDYRGGTAKEDKHGGDYIVAGRRGIQIRIDVKASLFSILKRGGHEEEPYVVDSGDGLVTMYSLLSDTDLNDRFRVSDSIAADRGEVLEGMLRYIETTNSAVALGNLSARRHVAGGV
jgi:hypothetical protein